MGRKDIAQRLFDSAYKLEVALNEFENYMNMAREALEEIDKIQKELKKMEV